MNIWKTFKLGLKRYLFRRKLWKTQSTRISKQSIGYMNVDFEGENDVPQRCQFTNDKITIGFRTTLGYNNLISGNVRIGKYCQLGSDVSIHAANHPMNTMTTYINRRLFEGELKGLRYSKQIVLGNDVWVGHGVIIVGQVTIGNGAIIAAGAVVTKDVPAFGVVAGVPAKLINYRFSPAIIQEIEALKWWDKNDAELSRLKPLFFKYFDKATSIHE